MPAQSEVAALATGGDLATAPPMSWSRDGRMKNVNAVAAPMAAAIVVLQAGFANAQDLKPAPDYYLDAVVAFTAAETLARSCRTVSVDPVALTNESERILKRLADDGFDTTRPDAGMVDPSEELNSRLVALMTDYGLKNGSEEDEVCAAAREVMAESGQISGFLLEVPG